MPSADRIPGPRPPRFGGRRVSAHRYAADPVAYTVMLSERHGPVCGLVEGDQKQIFAFGPALNKAVLTDGDTFHTVLEYATPAGIKAARRGIGLLNMNGPWHRTARRTIAPSFRPGIILGQAEEVARVAIDDVATWPAEFDLHRRVRDLTLRIACKLMFGVDIVDDPARIGDLVAQMLALRYFASNIRYFPYDVPGAPYRRLLTVIRTLDSAIEGIVETRRGLADAPADLLSGLLDVRDDEGNGLTTDEIIGHLTTFIVAGHETSSSTLAWTFVLLDQHPEINAAVRAEAATWPADPAGLAAAAMASPLLDSVIKEVLRLLPPGPNTSRIAVAPAVLGGFDVPAGSQVITSKYVTHRDPAVFLDPLRFRPDRWATAEPALYEYLPFGAGPHVCIGAAFATLELKIIIGAVLRRHAIALVPDAVIARNVGLMMSPRHGVPVTAGPVAAAPRPARISGDIHQMVHLESGRES